jgi:glycosyltransferase involved in cell wall biosynthesis
MSRGDTLVIFHGVWAGIYHQVAGVCRERNIPYVVIPHGSLDPFDLKKKSVLKRLLGPLVIKRYLDGAMGLVCSTPTEARVLETYGSMTPRNVVPWPLSSPSITAFPNRDAARRKFDVESGDFVILFMSRINYKKGLERLIDGCELAGRKIQNLRLLVAGTGERRYESGIRLRASDCRSVKVDFLGHLGGEEKAAALAASDGFALISDNENFGFSIFEALAAGLPCLITKQIYIWEELVEAGATFLCEPNPKSVADAIVQLQDASVLTKGAFAEAAVASAARFSPANLEGRYYRLLEHLGVSLGREGERADSNRAFVK